MNRSSVVAEHEVGAILKPSSSSCRLVSLPYGHLSKEKVTAPGGKCKKLKGRLRVKLNKGEKLQRDYHAQIEDRLLSCYRTLLSIGRRIQYFPVESGESDMTWYVDLASLCSLDALVPIQEGSCPVLIDNEWDACLDLFSRVICNQTPSSVTVRALGTNFTIPSKSSFLLSDLSKIDLLLTHPGVEGSKFGLVVLDPPWENRSAIRGKKYTWISNEMLLQIPMPSLMAPCCVVVVWVTNKRTIARFVQDVLFPSWNVMYVGEWHWIKVTTEGELVWPMDSAHKKPYETLLIGRRMTPCHTEQSPHSSLCCSSEPKPSSEDDNTKPQDPSVTSVVTSSGDGAAELVSVVTSPGDGAAELVSVVTSPGDSAAELVSVVTSPGDGATELISVVTSPGDGAAELISVVTSPGDGAAELVSVVTSPGDGAAELVSVVTSPGDSAAELVSVVTSPGDGAAELISVVTSPGDGAAELVSVVTSPGDGAAELVSVVTSPGDGAAELISVVTSPGDGAAELVSVVTSPGDGAAELVSVVTSPGDGGAELVSVVTSPGDGGAELIGVVTSSGDGAAELVSVVTSPGDGAAELVSVSEHFQHAGPPFKKLKVDITTDKPLSSLPEKLPSQLCFLSVPTCVHSQKPCLGDLLSRYTPKDCLKLELFARNLLPGWTSWGNEVIKFQECHQCVT